MKRFTTTFMLLIYLLLNTGISYSMHFCGGKLTSSGLFTSRIGCTCPSSKEKMTSGCCRDIVIKNDSEDHRASTLLQINEYKILLTEIKFFFTILERTSSEILNFFMEDHYGPPFYKVPKFILHQIFRL